MILIRYGEYVSSINDNVGDRERQFPVINDNMSDRKRFLVIDDNSGDKEGFHQ